MKSSNQSSLKKSNNIQSRIKENVTTKSIWIFCLMLCMLISCGEEAVLDITNPKIKKALEVLRNIYAQEILKTCRAEVIKTASTYVDSLVAAEMFLQLSDSIVFPEKPIKPPSLGKIIISDTIRARPIFGK